jgi:hypothetical protein
VPTETEVSAPIGAIGTSQNGWMDNQIGAMWFTDQFIPSDSRKVSDNLTILFLDSHGSYESKEFCNSAFKHGIIVIAFPSKCTVTSGLDVSLNQQVK